MSQKFKNIYIFVSISNNNLIFFIHNKYLFSYLLTFDFNSISIILVEYEIFLNLNTILFYFYKFTIKIILLVKFKLIALNNINYIFKNIYN